MDCRYHANNIPHADNGYSLFYIGRIDRLFDSFKDIWINLDELVLMHKNASLNKYGDVYEPSIDTSTLSDWYDPGNYNRAN